MVCFEDHVFSHGLFPLKLSFLFDTLVSLFAGHDGSSWCAILQFQGESPAWRIAQSPELQKILCKLMGFKSTYEDFFQGSSYSMVSIFGQI